MKNSKKYGLLCLSLAFIFAVTAISAAAQNIKDAKSATFTGRGQIIVKAENAMISFCVESRGTDAAAVKKENDKVSEKLKKELSKYCIKDDCFYSYTDPCTGTVTATRSMTLFTENVDGVDSLTQKMLANGVSAIHCVAYGLNDPIPYQEKALSLAIADAESKARALEITLPLKEIIEFGTYSYPSGNCDGKNNRTVTVESNVNVVFAQ